MSNKELDDLRDQLDEILILQLLHLINETS